MQSRHKYAIFVVLALVSLILSIGYLATDVTAGATSGDTAGLGSSHPIAPNQQGTPVTTPRATASPTPPVGNQGEGIPTPVVFAIGLGIGLAVGYVIGRSTAPRNGPIDRTPDQRRG